MRIFRMSRTGWLAFVVWAIGLAGIWWLLPVGPREGWQPPVDETVCGFLKDGRTLLTFRQHALDGPKKFAMPLIGPIRLWDIETGELLGEHFGPDDFFRSVRVVENHDLLQVDQREGLPNDCRFRLRLLNAWTGEEVAALGCRSPHEDPSRPLWQVSPDAKTLVLATCEEDQWQIECREIASGKRLAVIPRVQDSIAGTPALCFSADGATFGMSQRPANGTNVLRFTYRVWEAATGNELGLSQPLKGFRPAGRAGSGSVVTNDGRFLVVLVNSGGSCWLAYHDLPTGLEVVERRIPLPPASDIWWTSFCPVTADGRTFVVNGVSRPPAPSVWRQWLAKIPGLRMNQTYQHHFILFETATGREIMRGEANIWGSTRDGRCLVTHDEDGSYSLWDVPPRKPLWRFLAWAAGWSALLSIVSWRRIRAAKTKETTPVLIGSS